MLINAMVRVVNIVGVVVFIIAIYASLSLVTQSSTVAGPVIGSECTASRCLFNSGATLDTAQIDDLRDTAGQDAAAEGQDVLIAEYATTPARLWKMLIDAGFRGDPTDDREALYVPVGTVVQDDGGLYLATLDGFMVCVNGVTTAGECSSTGPVVPVDMPMVPDAGTTPFV